MQDQQIQLPWEQSGWLEQVTAWIESQLMTSGWHSTGPVEIMHQRPWSTLIRVPTDRGFAFFKAPAPYDRYEAVLTQALERWRPDCTVPILAVDLDHGWLLSADAGVTLGDDGRTIKQIDHWLKVLPLNAELQIEMADRVTQLLEFGLPDMRLVNLSALYSDLLEDNENLRIGLDPGLTQEEYDRLRDLRPSVLAWCSELASYGLPDTLTHEEVHDWNVLVNDGQYIFIDWSEASITHPFVSAMVTIRAAAYRLELAENGVEMRRLRDAYLEPWTKFATPKELLSAFELAYHLGKIVRALSWNNGTGSLSIQHKEPYVGSVPGWLQYFLNVEIPRFN